MDQLEIVPIPVETSISARLVSTHSRIFGGLAALWLLLEIASYFIPTKPLSGYRVSGLIAFLLLAVFLGMAWELIFLSRALARTARALQESRAELAVVQRASESVSQDAATSLIAVLREAHAKRNWEEVITLGRPLSRPLWLTGRYQLRIEIGKLVEGAAAFSDRPDIQASALIDDLGWTSAALRQYEDALKYIRHGLSVAQKVNAYGLVSRAFRHLAGIHLKRGDIEQSALCASEAERALDKVTDAREHAELTAGLAYQRARELQRRGDFAAALPALVSAQELFARLADRDRALKVYGPIGQVQLEMGDVAAAKDSYRRGLATARLSARRDCELVSLIGLAAVARAEQSFGEARAFLLEASATASLLGDSEKAVELQRQAAKLAM